MFRLVLLKLYLQGYYFAEFLQVALRYYGNRDFGRIDRALLMKYFFRNPFRIAKKYLQAQGASDVYAYGETPLTTWEGIVEECGVDSEDTFLELGCGRGRLCFWLHYFVGCKVVGIEEIPTFVEIANGLGVDEIEFICANYLDVQLPKATVVYFYGTNLDDDTISEVIPKLKELGVGTRIISVSYPLSDYDSTISLEKQFQAHFPWGTTEIYLNIIT